MSEPYPALGLRDVVDQVIIQRELKKITVKVTVRKIHPKDMLIDPSLWAFPDVRSERCTWRSGPSEKQVSWPSFKAVRKFAFVVVVSSGL
jgi:hypothetical protein